MKNMYFLNKFCCLCLHNKSDLKLISDADNDGVSHYNKLTSSIAEMNFDELNNQRLVCGECCDTLNTAYNFRQMCLRSKSNLITYVSQLQTFSHVSGKNVVKLKIKIKKKKIDKSCSSYSKCICQYKSHNRSTASFSIKEETKSDLKYISDVDNDGLSYLIKLVSSIPEMCFGEMNDQRLICGECSITLNTVYDFRQMCLRSKTNLITYIIQLRTFSKVSGTLSVRLKDIKQKIKVEKQEIEIKREKEECNFEQIFIPQISTEQDYSSVSIKKELESEDDCSSSYGDASDEDVNEKEHTNIKVEDIEHQMTEDTDSKISMVHLKVECMDDSNTQDIVGVERSKINDDKDRIASNDPDRPFECEICHKTYTRRGALNKHFKTHSGERPFECNICFNRYTLKCILNAHMLTHSTEKPHKCSTCGKAFTKRSVLEKHIRLHTGERPHQCDVCNKKFIQKSSLRLHKMKHAGERPYECDICHKKFIYKGILTKHIQIHSGERPHKCKICKKKFLRLGNLEEHLRTHTNDRPYECELCGKKFGVMGNLNTHMKIHSNERIYKCEVCNKSFIRKFDRIKHLRIHTGEKSVECKFCKKAFIRKAYLNIHMRIHSGDRPYACNVCDKKYIGKQQLSKHMKVHSDDHPFQCESCKLRFISEDVLDKHTKTHINKKIIVKEESDESSE